MIKQIFTLSLTSVALMACASTTPQSKDASHAQPQASAVVSTATQAPVSSDIITLERIMSDPDWMGRAPQRGYWGDNSDSVLFYRKREGSPLTDLYVRSLDEDGNGKLVAVADLHEFSDASAIYNSDRSMQAYTFEGNIFVKHKDGRLQQVTHTSARETQPVFMTNGGLSYRAGNDFFVVDLTTGRVQEVASLKTADAPKGLQDPKGYLAEEQHELIDYVALKHQQSKDATAKRDALSAQNASIAAKPFYLGKGMSIMDAELSPAGDKIVVSVRKERSWREKTDIMPNYISTNGDILAVDARRRVADTKPIGSTLYLLDLTDNSKHALSFETLPGYDEDVLASVKAENAKAKGETYKSERKAREINLIWERQPINWNAQGTQVAVMLEAWDNKDRWIATVDFEDKALVTQHRLHDEAWINYTFNDFDWLSTGDSLYFLSEQSGYSHLYIKPLNGEVRALTSGNYVVDTPTLTADDQYVYFKANVKHPGIYEIYRVAVANGNVEALTDLNGLTDYELSPDGSKLLLQHSTVLMPPELYVQDAKVGATPTRLTHTVSEEFMAMPWTAPDIVPVESSHTEQPIYARVYKPADMMEGEKRRAVIFSHGAGYLQNSHLGWSGYFREFMFHSMLAQQGYVVMDMDYRASKGYGRDWRTAIYRDMGRPETEDLVDGVNWLVENANVDRQRIGTYGGSYGGFMTFMALFTEPDLFQAGAALRPVSDWAYYNHGYTSNILNTPDIDPIAYRRSSPIYFAEGLDKPLLINAPMIDDNVFFQDVVRLVQRLIELEKEDFETAIFPVEPHTFVQPSSWLDEYRRIYKLFEENL